MSAVSKAVWSRQVVNGLVVIGLVVVATPLDANACPSCLAAEDSDVQMAFLSATAFLSLLPLGLLGALFLWLRRRSRQLDAEEAAGVIRLPTAPPRTNRAA